MNTASAIAFKGPLKVLSDPLKGSIISSPANTVTYRARRKPGCMFFFTA
jgi:hypothetical protein